MCGIAGWFVASGREPDIAVLARMAKSIAHRGPDDEGVFSAQGAGVALAHRRLSIIDLSAGSHQPMVDPSSGVVLSFNGEIYNFVGLRRELEGRGHVFLSSGDTEVLLRSYLEWGVECLSRLAGMFALAIWDPRTASLHLARDAMGIKPLYVAQWGEGVAFASEVKAFAELPGYRAELDLHGLRQFLEFGYVFDGCGTILRGVEKVLPGQRLVLKRGRIVERVAWFVPPTPPGFDDRSEMDRVEELAEELGTVVAEHLVADVPVGLLLSGGLDSSLIAALASRSGPITTLCMGFAGSEVDERAQALRVAKFLGSRHLDVLIDASQIKREIIGGAWVFDDLFADWGTISTRLLYRRCRELGIKVVLVGEGADELFGGYDVFDQHGRLGLWRLFRLYQRYSGRRHGRLFAPFLNVMREHLRRCEGDSFGAIRLFESRQQLPNQYVMKVDKASMSESVEARAPYLDRRIAALAYRTPKDWLLRGGENKYLLRALARHRNLLPDATSGQRKFGAPLAAGWMSTDLEFRQFARDRILSAGSQTERLGLSSAMRAFFVDGHVGQRWPRALSLFSNLAWRLLLLELWAPRYLGAAGEA